MSAISEFANNVNQHNDRISAGLDAIGADVLWLKDKIEELQNTPGEITPEDQALLDRIEERFAALASRVEEVDAMTPPAPPVP